MSIPPPPGPQQPQEPWQPPHQPHPRGPASPQGPSQGPASPQGPTSPQGPAHPPGPQGPQNPYGTPPYQPWAQGYHPFNRPAPVNGVAVGALVLGLMCFFPGAGLVLGLVALRQIRRRQERGRGMAVAGAVLSGTGLALWALAIAGGVPADVWAGFKDAARGDGSAYSLRTGECFDEPGGSLEGETYDVDEVPCAGEHDGEVFASFTMKGYRSYPGDGKVTDVADARCYALRYDYAMDAWAVPDDVDVYYLTPTRQSWALGDRGVTCVFGNTDERGTLTGSLRNDGSRLNADQIAYLHAVNVENKVLDTQPVDTPDDDLDASREWAGRLSAALTEEAGLLRGHAWPAAAKQPVAAVAEDVRAAQKEWARAARATDPDTFYEHYGRAMAHSATDDSVTARKALGLDSTPPADAEGDGGGGGGELEV
ncbi:DUF4190 domain-containing protein [Streptomyces sp. H51]|uniref:DUF4190 domain-containing protein n=1 Tax=Streptomyces sp. H51 TaxID=3111770 RepID=UPI002D794469|nr:DUF4190 domain-containing protein [Streptomyces sp. H51]